MSGEIKEASVEFVNDLTDQLNVDKISSCIGIQRETLSAGRLALARKELTSYYAMVFDMKKDLDSIFRRLRVHKETLQQMYPSIQQTGSSTNPPQSIDDKIKTESSQNDLQ